MSEHKDYFNRSGAAAFIFSMVFVCTFFFYLAVIHPGVDLGENVIDPKALPGGAKFDLASVAEPWVANEQVVAAGAKIYAQNCALCHGEKGLGDGSGAAGLVPPPRNLVEGKWTKGEGFIAHYKVLTEGIAGTGMAGFPHLKPAERWALVQFIDSITNNKSKEDAAKVAEFAKTAK